MTRVGRRGLFKGLTLGAGACWIGPMLRQIEARAQGSMPKRLVIVVEGDCLNSKRFTPPETLAELTRVRSAKGLSGEASASWTSYVNDTPLSIVAPTLPVGFSPLAAHADDLVLVQGLSNRSAGGTGSHSADYGALSCANSTRSTPLAPTIDNVLAERLGSAFAFPRLALGAVTFKQNSDGSLVRQNTAYGTSAYGARSPAPVHVDPRSVHAMLFGTVSSTSAQQEVLRKSSLMDIVRNDLQKARSRVTGPERAQFDSYLSSVEALRDRQSKLLGMGDALRAGMPTLGSMYDSPHLLVRLEAQFELAAAALSTGLTEIVLIASACSNRYFSARYTSIDPEIEAKHHFGHGGSFGGKSSGEMLSEIHRRHSLLISGFIDKLKATPEASGSMWDNTMVVYTSDGGESHHANFYDWPTLLLAGKNIPIQKAAGGRSLVYPKHGSDNHRQMSNFWNTVAYAVGAPIDDFGEEGSFRIAEGPLPEILKT